MILFSDHRHQRFKITDVLFEALGTEFSTMASPATSVEPTLIADALHVSSYSCPSPKSPDANLIPYSCTWKVLNWRFQSHVSDAMKPQNAIGTSGWIYVAPTAFWG